MLHPVNDKSLLCYLVKIILTINRWNTQVETKTVLHSKKTCKLCQSYPFFHFLVVTRQPLVGAFVASASSSSGVRRRSCNTTTLQAMYIPYASFYDAIAAQKDVQACLSDLLLHPVCYEVVIQATAAAEQLAEDQHQCITRFVHSHCVFPSVLLAFTLTIKCMEVTTTDRIAVYFLRM